MHEPAYYWQQALRALTISRSIYNRHIEAELYRIAQDYNEIATDLEIGGAPSSRHASESGGAKNAKAIFRRACGSKTAPDLNGLGAAQAKAAKASKNRLASPVWSAEIEPVLIHRRED